MSRVEKCVTRKHKLFMLEESTFFEAERLKVGIQENNNITVSTSSVKTDPHGRALTLHATQGS